MDENGWRYKDGTAIHYGNFQRSLRMYCLLEAEREERGARRRRWIARREEQERERLELERLRLAEVRRRREAQKPETWALCQERCANAKEGCGCCRGWKVPPDRRSWPVPPEQCPNFKAKEVEG